MKKLSLKCIAVLFMMVLIVSCHKKKEAKQVVLNSTSSISDTYVVDYAPSVNTNYGSDEKIYCDAWTYGGTPVKIYTLLKFDYSSVPSGATITSAKLNLYSNLTSYFPTGNDSVGHYGPQSGTDLSWTLRRITASWDENTVTFTTKPGSTDANKLPMASPSAYNTSYLNIDVTQLVKDQIASGNYGFEASLDDYSPYKRLIFCSSEYTKDPSLSPSLTIEYKQ